MLVSSDDEDHISTYLLYIVVGFSAAIYISIIDLPASSHPPIHDAAAATSSVQMIGVSSVPERASDSSMEGEEYEQSKNPCPLDKLLNMFVGQFRAKQVMAVYRASGDNFDRSIKCLLAGPTLSSLLSLLNDHFQEQASVKVQVDPHDTWQDMVVHYSQLRWI